MSDLVKALQYEGERRVNEKEAEFGNAKSRADRVADDICHQAASRIEQLEREINTYIRLIDHDTKAMEKHWDELVEARRQAFEEAAQKARKWAAHYPHSSDGRNTFTLFAEWADDQASQCRAKAQPHSETRQEKR